MLRIELSESIYRMVQMAPRKAVTIPPGNVVCFLFPALLPSPSPTPPFFFYFLFLFPSMTQQLHSVI